MNYFIKNLIHTSVLLGIVLLLLLLPLFPNRVNAVGYQDGAFVTTWKTDNPGSSNKKQITISTQTSPSTSSPYPYNYNVDWGDGQTSTGVSGNITHKYSNSGTYTVSITGTFSGLRFQEGANDSQKLISVEQWGNVKWMSMLEAFRGAKNLIINATDAPDLSLVTDMSHVFRDASSVNQNLGSWDVSSVKDMTFAFLGASSFNQDISSWDVSNVETMHGMFKDATSFNQDISNWDISGVTSMWMMFSGASSFNNGDIDDNEGRPLDWEMGEVSNLYNTEMMFYNATSFNQDISTWDVSGVTNMTSMFERAYSFNNGGEALDWTMAEIDSPLERTAKMFYLAISFNQDISSWNMSGVTDISEMFRGAYLFNQNISSWDVSNVYNMFGVFYGATSFNQNISSWDVSSVTRMANMFYNATSFNQDISSWNVSNVQSMYGMFRDISLSKEIYDNILNSWSSLTLQEGVYFDAGNSQYSFEKIPQRDILINAHNWEIADGGVWGPKIQIIGVTISDSKLTLIFDQDIDPDSIPSPDNFSIVSRDLYYLNNFDSANSVKMINPPGGVNGLTLNNFNYSVSDSVLKIDNIEGKETFFSLNPQVWIPSNSLITASIKANTSDIPDTYLTTDNWKEDYDFSVNNEWVTGEIITLDQRSAVSFYLSLFSQEEIPNEDCWEIDWIKIENNQYQVNPIILSSPVIIDNTIEMDISSFVPDSDFSYFVKYEIPTTNQIKGLNGGYSDSFIYPLVFVTLDENNKNIKIKDHLNSVIINMTSISTIPLIDTTNLITSGQGSLPLIQILSNLVNVTIPAGGVTSQSSDWSGLIQAPTETTIDLPEEEGRVKKLRKAFEVGDPESKLTFENAVRIELLGEAGNKAGYISGDSSFVEITDVCQEDSLPSANDNLGENGSCKIDVGKDLIIWTKHFSKFATFEDKARKVSSGGGGSYRSKVDDNDIENSSEQLLTPTPEPTTPKQTPTTQKQYNFGQSLISLGYRGETVKELQRFLNNNLNLNLQEDGVFGQKTKEAVTLFQKSQNLKADGVVGPETKAKMLGGTTENSLSSSNLSTLDIQRYLNQKLNLNLTEDGIFGPKTKEAVKLFQRTHNLKEDGIVGPETMSKMGE